MGSRDWSRGLLALLIVIAFARVTWRLDAKNLWWDESLSLQRAESDWPALLTGRIVISDGHSQLPTLDQHPFAYFALLSAFIRLVGEQEFSLRFLSVMAVTLLVPVLWAFARLLTRLNLAPRSAEIWAALLAAASPFYLWFGQETRPYAIWAFLALLSTYLLLCFATSELPSGVLHSPGAVPMAQPRPWRVDRRFYLLGYLPVTIALLSTHYFSIFLLPFQGLIAWRGLRGRGRHLATVLLAVLLVLAALVALIVARLILDQVGAGTNFQSISLQMLVPDLNNAFSLGLSVDIDRVRWLDLLFGAVALLGLAWGARSREALLGWGWVLPAFVFIPVAVLLSINLVRPIWMTARHMSMISGAYLLMVAVGLGVLWRRNHWLGGALAAVMVGGMVCSTYNYFTLPQYAKDDLAGVGSYLRKQLQPGDLALLVPPEGLRLMRYYLPLDDLQQGGRTGMGASWEAVPPLLKASTDVESWLGPLTSQHRRTWLVKSGVPAGKSVKPIEQWLNANAFRVRDTPFQSMGADLRVELYLPAVPVFEHPPRQIQYPLDASFGDQVRLLGYDVGQPLMPGAALPVTLYWQALQPLTRRYKYILRMEEVTAAESGGGGDITVRAASTTEREPYDGAFSTTSWPPEKVVVEYTEVGAPAEWNRISDRYRLVLQMYDAETLTKLPVTTSGDVGLGPDGETLVLPYSS
jgi:uncharacterized membrane protein